MFALKIKRCQSRSWQGRDRGKYFGREILTQFNVAKILILNKIANLCLFWKIKGVPMKDRARARQGEAKRFVKVSMGVRVLHLFLQIFLSPVTDSEAVEQIRSLN